MKVVIELSDELRDRFAEHARHHEQVISLKNAAEVDGNYGEADEAEYDCWETGDELLHEIESCIRTSN